MDLFQDEYNVELRKKLANNEQIKNVLYTYRMILYTFILNLSLFSY
jgi:hypothetical protein